MPEIQSIGQIAINIHDLPRALSFYRDTLGLKFLFEAPPSMAFFDCGGVRLMLSRAEPADHDHPGSILYYLVGDLKAAHEAISSRGAHFLQPPHLVASLPDHDLWMAFLADTEGNTLALMSEVAR